MSSAMFGAPAGISQAIQDEGTIAQADYVRGKTAMLPADLAHMQAQTAHLNAQTTSIPSEIEARRLKMDIDRRKAPAEIEKLWSEVGENVAQTDASTYALQEAKALKEAMIEASQNGGFAVDAEGKPVSMASSIARVGMRLLSGGFSSAADKAFNQASLMAGHDTSQDRLTFEKRKAELEEDLKMYELVGHRTPWITNQQQLNDLNADITKRSGKPPPWGHLPYSPELVQTLNDSSLKYSERANFQLKEEKALFDQRQRELRNTVDDLRLQLDKTKFEWQKEKGERDKKAGVISPAGASDVDAVMQLAIQQNPKLKELKGQDAAALDQFSRSVADEAKKIYKQHDGALSMEQARYKALTSNMEQLTVGSDWGSTTVKYDAKGVGTREVPLPDSGDASTRKEGKWYNVKGKVLRWDPKGDPKQPWTTE